MVVKMRSRGGGAKGKGTRKAPEVSSKTLKVGTIMIGADKKQWVVKEYKIKSKKIHKWTPLLTSPKKASAKGPSKCLRTAPEIEAYATSIGWYD